MKVEICPSLWFVTWLRGRCVMWLCGWDPFILSHHPAKFGIHSPCESGDITSLICHVTTWSSLILSHHSAKFEVHRPCESGIVTFYWFVAWPRYRSVTWLCGWGPLILSHYPAKFVVNRPYGTGNNDVCNISSSSNSISNSNSNADVPMPRFTNGQFKSFSWNVGGLQW